MSDPDLQKLVDLLQSFQHAMLVSRRNDDLRSRPMAIGDVTDDGRIRFITRDDSAKLEELDEHPRVNIAAQGERKFLSVAGNARLSKDRDLIDKAWKSGQALWFSDGKDDPHVIVIEIIPTYAEYWNRTEAGFITQVIDGLREAAGDEPPDDDALGERAKVDLRDEPV